MGFQTKLEGLTFDGRIASPSIFSLRKIEMQAIYTFSSESCLMTIIFLNDRRDGVFCQELGRKEGEG